MFCTDDSSLNWKNKPEKLNLNELIYTIVKSVNNYQIGISEDYLHYC